MKPWEWSPVGTIWITGLQIHDALFQDREYFLCLWNVHACLSVFSHQLKQLQAPLETKTMETLCFWTSPSLRQNNPSFFFVILSPNFRYSTIANKWNKLMKQFMCLNFMYSLNIFYIFFKSKKKNFIVRFLHIAGGGWMRMRHWERGSRDFITLLDSWNTPSAVFGNGREGFSTYERGMWLMSQCHVTLTLHISLHLYAIFLLSLFCFCFWQLLFRF